MRAVRAVHDGSRSRLDILAKSASMTAVELRVAAQYIRRWSGEPGNESPPAAVCRSLDTTFACANTSQHRGESLAASASDIWMTGAIAAILPLSIVSVYPFALATIHCFVPSLTIPCDLRTSSAFGTSPCLM